MKIVKNFLTMIFLAGVSQFVNAASISPTYDPVVTQIRTLIKGIDYDQYVGSETKMNITFFINAQNEIIVVSTNNKDLDEVMKSTLNYKKISMKELEYNKIYTIPVVIK